MSDVVRDRVEVWREWSGLWLVRCRCCCLEGSVITDRVDSWASAMGAAWVHVAEAHRVLSASDLEPPVGSRVRDDCGTVWVNDGYRPACWVRPDLVAEGVHDPETWMKIAGTYGPVTVLNWGETDG